MTPKSQPSFPQDPHPSLGPRAGRARRSGRSRCSAGVAWAFLQPWRLTMLHPARRRASGGSSSSRRCSSSSPGCSSTRSSPAGIVRDLEEARAPDAAARRARPLAVRDRASSSSGCCCSRRRSSAARSGASGSGAPTSGRRSLFGLGVFMWPVMVFFTNSTIHMLAHSAWAQMMMLAGARRARARQREAQERVVEAVRAARVRGLGRGVSDPRGEPVALLALGVRPPRVRLDPARRRALPARRRVQAALARLHGRLRARAASPIAVALYTSRDVAPVFGHLDPTAGVAHR